MTMFSVKANFARGERRIEQHDGAEHLVVPVVMIVEGVLNEALLLAEEFGAFPDAWNGIPVPVLHPEENGSAISANRPDVIERNTIGRVYNTHVEDKRLRAELWLNMDKAEALGFQEIVVALADGFVMEVSTGYFAEDEVKSGEYNGRTYSHIHRGIRPDHLALLPGQIGACSVKDGCGTRVNSKRSSLAMKVNEAWAVLGRALRLNTNCQCEENSMDIVKKAEGLVKANKLDAKQLAAIQEMEPKDRELMAAFIGALGAAGVEEAAEEDLPPEAAPEELPAGMSEDEEPAKMAKTNKSLTQADIDRMVANKVDEHLRRRDVVATLKANTRNTLTSAQMSSMTVEQLEAVESMIRPADYSGAGAFATNSGAMETTVTPLRPRGVLAKKEG
jgi:hypothetical protein